MTKRYKIILPLLGILTVSAIQALSAAPGALAAAPGGPRGGGRGAAPVDPNPRTLAPYFTPATTTPKAPDAEGFLQRWMLLEPINNSLRGNTGFTESYIRNTFKTEYFKDQYSIIPKDGDKVTVNGEQLAWHALDSSLYNIKLYRFAYGLNRPVYGITCFAFTVVDSPRELKDVRLAVGSNSASMWWVNGTEAVGLFGDRRMVADDGISKRLMLNKGQNVIRGVVINGPGMSDFCARFIDEQGAPVKDLTQSFDNMAK